MALQQVQVTTENIFWMLLPGAVAYAICRMLG
jgi:hypothetical protein